MHDEEFQQRKATLDQEWLTSMDQEGMVLEDAVLARTIRTRKVSLYRCEGMALQAGQRVVVETERGTTEGVILEDPARRWVQVKTVRRIVRPIDRPPEGWQAQRYQEREKQARSACHELLTRLKLDMKLVDVELVWWENRTVFYFVAEGRVDFRDMVKDLSRNLRCRIEMRQVGPRDETKMLRGYGRCGREHCCSNFLSEFHSVRTKMAKEQGIVVNQDKITGHCRKLLCCLSYERETYAALRQEMPAVGSRVETPDGKGKTVELHVIRGGIKVLLDDGGGFREFPLDKVRLLDSDGLPIGGAGGGAEGAGDDAAFSELEDDGTQPRDVVVVEEGDGTCADNGGQRRPDGQRPGDRGSGDRRQGDRPRSGGDGRGGQRPGDRGDGRRDDRRPDRGDGRRDDRRPDRGDGRRDGPRPDSTGGQAPVAGEPAEAGMPLESAPDAPRPGLSGTEGMPGTDGVPGTEGMPGTERTGRRRRRRRRGGGGGQGQRGPGGTAAADGQADAGTSEGAAGSDGWDGGPDDADTHSGNPPTDEN